MAPSIEAAWCCSACAKKASSPPSRRRQRASLRACGSVRIPEPRKRSWGYAKEFLRQQFRDRFGGDHPPDWQVRTTFVPELQDAAERAVENGLRRFGKPGTAGSAGRDRSRQPGDILAMVGGRDFRESQFNRAWRSRRQPGSAFKPFLYAAALEHGLLARERAERPRRRSQPQGPDEWAPRNASGEDPDALTLRAALIESNNRAATLAAAAHRHRVRCCGSHRTSACGICPTCRRCRSGPAW